MATEPPERQMLPVACTLGPGDGLRRVEDWRRVISAASAGRDLGDGKLTLRFRDEGGAVGVELARLVSAERDCCAFLGWELGRVGDEWRVEITGDDADLRALSLAEEVPF